MKKHLLLILSFLLLIGISISLWQSVPQPTMSGAPPYGEPEEAVPPNDPLMLIQHWQRPGGPPRVGLQVGHWKNNELPEELAQLHGNTGASGGGKSEWEVNLKIAELTAQNLRQQGIIVDILPATIPPQYWADVFLAIHADGNVDKTVSGFKFAAPWRDYTKKASKLVTLLEVEYAQATGLAQDFNISRNMRGYYAFAWWRYEHSLHPMTTAAIAETGFLTNSNDQKILIQKPEIAAQALAKSISTFLQSEEIIR